MNRLGFIDGLRGYFLVFMMINHLNFTGGYWLVKLNHNQLAFVEDAQGFIFLSGPVSYTHLTLPRRLRCRSRWSPYH